jgi:hypothetical protein
MERSDELRVGRKRTADASRFNVGKAFGKLSVDDPSLLRRVLVIRARRLLRNDYVRFLFDGDAHNDE